MSTRKKVIVVIVLFVLLPGFIAFITEKPESRNQIIVGQETSSPSPSQSTCLDIRTERTRLEEANDKRSEDTLKEINMLQKKFLLGKLEELSSIGKISPDEFRQIKEISEGTLLERLESFPENFLDVSSTLDRLIKQKHLSPYFQKEVIALGEQLAASSNPTFAFILSNRTCFDDLDVRMAENFESFDAKSIESGWGKKKNGQDFTLVLNRG